MSGTFHIALEREPKLQKGWHHFWWDTHVWEIATLSWQQQNQTHLLNPTSMLTNLVSGKVVRGSREQWRMLRGCSLNSFLEWLFLPLLHPPPSVMCSKPWAGACFILDERMLASCSLEWCWLSRTCRLCWHSYPHSGGTVQAQAL